MSNGPFYATKYALTSGVKKLEIVEVSGDYAYFRHSGGWGSTQYRLGRDIFDNEADAKADAEKRRAKKIASLKKQIAKLEGMVF